jgi:hypothetical protein
MAAAALLVTDAEPETRGFLERHLPRDGFELVGVHGAPDLVSPATSSSSSAGSSGHR